MGNLAACSTLMSRLRSLGCIIALDDFGTGMSSFSYLRNLPIDLLKIDRAFIHNVDKDPIDHALVETIQRIAGIMGVRTVAEGVESEEVLEVLALIGVDFAQACMCAARCRWCRSTRKWSAAAIPAISGAHGFSSCRRDELEQPLRRQRRAEVVALALVAAQ